MIEVRMKWESGEEVVCSLESFLCANSLDEEERRSLLAGDSVSIFIDVALVRVELVS